MKRASSPIGILVCTAFLTLFAYHCTTEDPVATRAPVPAAAPRAGRLVRRMNAGQVRAAMRDVIGVLYTGKAWVIDPSAPLGYALNEKTDFLNHYAGTIGKPDYDLTVRENLEPGVAFSKFVEDAARATCTEVANREILGDGQAGGGTSARAHLLLKALPADTLGNNEAAIRANMVALA